MKCSKIEEHHIKIMKVALVSLLSLRYNVTFIHLYTHHSFLGLVNSATTINFSNAFNST